MTTWDRTLSMGWTTTLSGYDGDGSEGFIAIKAGGGITYAQDRSAQVEQMPQHAMATGCIDHVLNPAQIAERISEGWDAMARAPAPDGKFPNRALTPRIQKPLTATALHQSERQFRDHHQIPTKYFVLESLQ